jgi:hypothetical protein
MIILMFDTANYAYGLLQEVPMADTAPLQEMLTMYNLGEKKKTKLNVEYSIIEKDEEAI